MTEHPPTQRDLERSMEVLRKAQPSSSFLTDRIERRRKRIEEEIARNRRGEYTVPTWVLGAALAAIVGAWAALIIFT